MTSLTKQVVKGGFWITSLKVFSKGLSVIRIVVLARLLAPVHFGIMGVITLCIAFLYRFSQTGMGLALIQKNENIEDYMGTTYVLNVFRGLLISAILFFGAGWLAGFFNNADVAPYLKVAALSPFLLSFLSPRTIYLDKELQLQNRFIIESTATFIDIALSIIFALILRNAWALVYGLIAGNLTRVILSFVLYPWRPRFHFDKNKALELFHFGKWIFINGMLLFVATQGADILAGKVLGLAALGLYQMAYRLTNLISSEIHHVFNQVTYPAYSKIQHDKGRLKNAFLRVIQLVTIISLPVTVLIYAFSADFTIIFLGEKWLAIIPAMKILACISLFSSVGSTIPPLFMSVGRPDIPSKLQVLNVFILLGTLYPLTVKFNIAGTACAILITHVALFPFRLYLLNKLIDCRPSEIFKQFHVPVMCAVVTIVVILLSKGVLFKEVQLFHFFLNVSLAVLAYAGTLLALDRKYKLGFSQALRLHSFKDFLSGLLKT